MKAGDKIAGATGAKIKVRAERKLGGKAEALPHTGSRAFILFGGPLRALEPSSRFAAQNSRK
jgi:hypothetical protein